MQCDVDGIRQVHVQLGHRVSVPAGFRIGFSRTADGHSKLERLIGRESIASVLY